MSATGEDSLLGGAVRLLQPVRGHRAGTDAVLLAAAAPASTGDVVTDAGAGTGAVGLMIAARLAVRLILVERDAALADLCRHNLALNGREGHVADSRPPRPPFLGGGGPCGRRGRSRRHQSALSGSGQGTAVARSGRAPPRMSCPPAGTGSGCNRAPPCCGLGATARPRCSGLTALAAILAGLEGGFGAIVLRFVHPRAEESAIRVLVRAVKGSRAPLTSCRRSFCTTRTAPSRRRRRPCTGAR